MKITRLDDLSRDEAPAFYYDRSNLPHPVHYDGREPGDPVAYFEVEGGALVVVDPHTGEQVRLTFGTPSLPPELPRGRRRRSKAWHRG